MDWGCIALLFLDFFSWLNFFVKWLVQGRVVDKSSFDMSGTYNVFNHWIILFLIHSNKHMLRTRNFIEHTTDATDSCLEVLTLLDVTADLSEWSKMWDKLEL